MGCSSCSSPSFRNFHPLSSVVVIGVDWMTWVLTIREVVAIREEILHRSLTVWIEFKNQGEVSVLAD